MGKKEVRTVCRICYARCRIILHIEDGIISAVTAEKEHLCPQGRALGEIVHAPDRLLCPMLKDGNGWKKISWSEALQFIAGRLKDIRQEYGAQALDIHIGYGRTLYDIRDYVRRFGNVFGTPNLSSSGSQCNTARVIGNSLTYGYFPVPDYERTNCIILWGSNPTASNPYVARAIRDAHKRGAQLIVVDPRNISLARQAYAHLRLKPGTDRALALGMLHVIIGEGLYDREFVSRWTIGFEKLANEIQAYKPGNMQEITGVPSDSIEQAARLYASIRPACIVQVNALEHHIDGVQAMRAIAILQAICGNLDVPGGAVMNPEHQLADIRLDSIKSDVIPIGANEYPLFYKFKGEAQANLLADAILKEKPYPIKGMIVVGANPVLTFPNSGKLSRALDKLEFLAVMDIFLTETAKHADIVLPAATFLEGTELCDLRPQRPLPSLALIPQAVPVRGESWPDWKFWFELGKQMGYDAYFPWKNIEEAISFRLKPLGITIEQLGQEPNGILVKDNRYKKYEKRGFSTPSGKVEIYSESMEKHGYNPLPTFNIEKNSDDKILFSTGARVNEFTHSRYRNIPSLRHRRPEPLAEISPETAQKLGINDGDSLAVQTKVGEIAIKVELEGNVLPGTIFLAHGWEESNVNVLADDENLDPISGFPSVRAMPCNVRR